MLPPAVAQAQSPQQAVRALQTALPALQAAADSALHRAHSPQTAALRLESHNFSARDYGSFSLPGGEYTALRIELGTAQGRNWFCVLYPSLCISGSTAAYDQYFTHLHTFHKTDLQLFSNYLIVTQILLIFFKKTRAKGFSARVFHYFCQQSVYRPDTDKLFLTD